MGESLWVSIRDKLALNVGLWWIHYGDLVVLLCDKSLSAQPEGSSWGPFKQTVEDGLHLEELANVFMKLIYAIFESFDNQRFPS